MLFDGGRILLDPQPVQTQEAALEVVMLGHCPGNADIGYLLAKGPMRQQMEAVGYAEHLARLEADPVPEPLYDLPIPLDSLAQFQQLFPKSVNPTPARYRSRIAGDYRWLPQAVADFFEQPSSRVEKKLWVININEAFSQAGFLPTASDDWLEPGNNSAFTRALMLPRVGLLVMPDLERLQIPAQLHHVPKLRVTNPAPAFLPCSASREDGVRERSRSSDIISQNAPAAFGELVVPVLKALRSYRPDMHWLFALPFDLGPEAELPKPSVAALADINELQKSQLHHDLHRLQLLYPYLKSAPTRLISASGLIAGAMASRTATHGAWSSTAGQVLPGGYQAFPPIALHAAAQLRDAGIGVVRSRRGRLELDDERLTGGVFAEQREHSRSGEVARFLGWLRRQLEQLGNQLIFDVAPGDPRPMIALRNFFTRLHRVGALRGHMPEQAFSIRELRLDSTLIYEIEIAPAFPIDRIRLSFSQRQLEVKQSEVHGV